MTTQGVATPTKLLFPGAIRMQGAMSAYGIYFISSSDPKTSSFPAPGTLFYGWVGGGTLVEHGYPVLPEDLHYSSFSDNIWSLTEHPTSRDVFTVKRSSMLYGCGN